VPSDSSKVWVDITFTPSLEGDKDTSVEVVLADADVIGSYSMPVIYSSAEPVAEEISTWVTYFRELSTTSGIENVPVEFLSVEEIVEEGILPIVALFTLAEASSVLDDIKVVYCTGYNTISGSLDKVVAFTAGRNLLGLFDTAVAFSAPISVSGIEDRIVNYTNFSGDLTTSGTPIPLHESSFSYIVEYGDVYFEDKFGAINRIVNISFAGWVDFPLRADIYSSYEGYQDGYELDLTCISGSLLPHYMDIYSTILKVGSLGSDLYCALLDYSFIGSDIQTTDGRIYYNDIEIFSAALKEAPIVLDIDLFSIKIHNFSLDEGEYTTASGFISVDVTDDTCPITTSGTYFKVNGIQVPTTLEAIYDGYRLFYDPADDFASISGPTVFTVHAENDCGKVIEKDYYLTFGYIVSYENSKLNEIDYGYYKKVAVRVVAENYATCPKVSSLAWEFESRSMANVDLSASITGRFHAWDDKSLPARIYPQSTAYFYGKEIRVVVNAKDFSGNDMEPFVLVYKIEDKP
jgi:hypothetical protein